MQVVSPPGAVTPVCRASAYKPLVTADGPDVPLPQITPSPARPLHSMPGSLHSAPLLSGKSCTSYPSCPSWFFFHYFFFFKKRNWGPSHVQPPHWNNIHVLDYSNEKTGSSRALPLSSAHSGAVWCQRDQGRSSALQACCCSSLLLLRY